MAPVEIVVPDSAVAVAARDLAREVSSVALFNHCERTYRFAAVMGNESGMSFDPEVLYVASLLHDLGLTERFDGPGEFETEGADAARTFLIGRGYPEERADLIREAISLHTRVGTEDHERAEVPLLRLGAGVDVLGLGIEDVPPAWVERAVAEFPREGLKEELARSMGAQAARKPDSWLAMLVDHLDWLDRIRAAPFTD